MPSVGIEAINVFKVEEAESVNETHAVEEAAKPALPEAADAKAEASE